jgi:hypothetical protein
MLSDETEKPEASWVSFGGILKNVRKREWFEFGSKDSDYSCIAPWNTHQFIPVVTFLDQK